MCEEMPAYGDVPSRQRDGRHDCGMRYHPRMAANRLLHVANGTSTTRLIESAGIPGTLSIWADPLYEGAVPAVSDASLVEVRARHLARCGRTAADIANALS